jgi:peroxiredoxin/outer membrane lipoprotein-sorting protein
MTVWNTVLLTFLAAAPAAPPTAQALLDRVSQSYRSMTSYRFEGVIHVDMNVLGSNQSMDMPVLMAAVKPGRTRTEMRNPAFSMISVSNGETSWVYVPQLAQYTKRVSAPIPSGDSAGTVDAMAAGTPLARYVAMSRGLKDCRLVREEPVELDGAPVDCHVVEADYELPPGLDARASPTTFWIDNARSAVLKESVEVEFKNQTGQDARMRQTTSYALVLVNETLPDTLFSFRPPDDAKEVEEISVPGRSESGMTGKTAPDFTLKNLKGRPTSLAAFKGRVVLLDFWASWCVPCRRELPTITRLDRELRSRGLAVIGVNVGETAAVAGAFVKQNKLAFTVLLDEKQEVAQKYGAAGLPTVVIIDRSGTIASHFVGVQSEADLREALKKVGIQ